MPLKPRHKTTRFWAAVPLIVFFFLPAALLMAGLRRLGSFAALVERELGRVFTRVESWALQSERGKKP